ncbi:MAG: ribulose-phosphate 3-epimerase [Anaerolineae bacterium]|nr:ribulose-phosphate 3-epimerase [Anaerolineae bacterium]MBN8619181.1 ribulose-phosphate 3-epimerase [Anaerolineae bacterium]
MTAQIRIAPSILAADFARLGEQIKAADQAGADLIHVDVMDGRFVPNLSFGALVVEAARRSTQLPLDVHLMILEPDHLLKDFADAGASSMTVHVEACPHLHRTLQNIRSLGCKAGVALNPHTPASAISEVIHLLDEIIVMSVNPGFGGQSFLPEVLPKTAQLRQMITASGREIALEIDGGVHTGTALQCVEAGADVLIAGSAVFSSKFSVAEGVKALRESVANKKPV